MNGHRWGRLERQEIDYAKRKLVALGLRKPGTRHMLMEAWKLRRPRVRLLDTGKYRPITIPAPFADWRYAPLRQLNRGDRGKRWQWPPLPGHPTHGWRAKEAARLVLRWVRRNLRTFIPRHDFLELVDVSKGKIPFSHSLVRKIEVEVARHRAVAAAYRKVKHPTFRLAGIGSGEGVRLVR